MPSAKLSAPFQENTDEFFMRAAIAEAEKAAAMHEVPIGAVAVADGTIVGRAHNVREVDGNPLGHAELLLLQQLATASPANRILPVTGDRQPVTDWRLTDVTIFVTCEPCLMCAGALLQARIPRLVYGCADPKAGACGSLYEVTNDPRLNHRIAVTAGCLAKECAHILSEFFRLLRAKK